MRIHFVLPLIFLFLVLVFPPVFCSGQPDLRSRVRDVYVLLVRAEAEGGNVSAAALKLNEALQLIGEAEKVEDESERSRILGKADSLIREVEASVPGLVEEGHRGKLLYLVTMVSVLVFLLVFGFVFYFYGPRFLWGLWLRSRGKWRVRKS